MYQLDGVLRTVLDAGEAIFAIALEGDAARSEADALAGTDAGAETAIDAAVRTQAEEGFAPDGEDGCQVGKDGLATLALLVAEDGDVVFLGGDVGDGLGDVRLRVCPSSFPRPCRRRVGSYRPSGWW